MPKTLQVTITTIHSVYASRDAGIHIKLIGDSTESNIIQLKSKSGWDRAPLLRKWERDPVETFLSLYKKKQEKKENDDKKPSLKKTQKIEEGEETFSIHVPDDFPVEETQKIEIGYDHSRFVDGWLIGKVTLRHAATEKEWNFRGPGTYDGWKDGTLTLILEDTEVTTDSTDSGATPDLHHRFVMGPILGYKGTAGKKYKLCCLVATEGDDTQLKPLSYSVGVTKDSEVIVKGRTPYLTTPLAASGDYKLWRYDWQVPRHRDQDYVCQYTLPDNRSFVCHIPAYKTQPHIVFGSCAGLETQEEIRTARDCNIMWVHMRNEHTEKPFHLLLLGGDQVYADPIITKLRQERKEKGLTESDVDGLVDEARIMYFELYISRWRQPEQAYMFARVPSFMIWDDHDIFDGWGSRENVTPFMTEVYKAARENFNLFQLRGLRQEVAMEAGNRTISLSRHSVTWMHPPVVESCDPRNDPGPFSYIVTFGDVCIVILDNRSERTICQAMSDESWLEFTQLLGILRGFKHIFFVIAVPLAYANFHSLLSVVRKAPVAEIKDLEDDIIDHWGSPHHDFERKRLYKALLDHCLENNSKMTVLSGDVHVGCWAKLKSESGITIDMVTSSAIVNKPPPAIHFLFDILTDDEKFYLPKHGKVRVWLAEVDETDTKKRLVARQNFLILAPEHSSTGEFTGEYRARFVKKAKENFEKAQSKKLLLKQPKKFGRLIEKGDTEALTPITDTVNTPTTDSVNTPTKDAVSPPTIDPVSAPETNHVSTPETDPVSTPTTEPVCTPTEKKE
ncbi:uncharacterized protein LOC144433920 [Glandiceps talaboti]